MCVEILLMKNSQNEPRDKRKIYIRVERKQKKVTRRMDFKFIFIFPSRKMHFTFSPATKIEKEQAAAKWLLWGKSDEASQKLQTFSTLSAQLV